MLAPMLPHNELRKYHKMFYALAQMGDPVWDNRVRTASVQYNAHTKSFVWRFNPHFYNSLTDTEKAFVVAHEIIHIINDHPGRIKSAILGNKDDQLSTKEHKQALAMYNIAADVVNNETLKSVYGFELSPDKMPHFANGGIIDYDYIRKNVPEDVIKQVVRRYSMADLEFVGEDNNEENEDAYSEQDEEEIIEEILKTSSMDFYKDLFTTSNAKAARENNWFKIISPDNSENSEHESSGGGQGSESGSSANRPDDSSDESDETNTEQGEGSDEEDSQNETSQDSGDGYDDESENSPEFDDSDTDSGDNTEGEDSDTEEDTEYESDDAEVDDEDEGEDVDDEDDDSDIDLDHDIDYENVPDVDDKDEEYEDDEDVSSAESAEDEDDGYDEDEGYDEGETDSGTMSTLDDHAWNDDYDPHNASDVSLPEMMKNIMESLSDMDMSESDKQEIADELKTVSQEAGMDGDYSELFVVVPRPKPKPKWETIIKKWVQATIEEFAYTEDNWFGDKPQFQWLNLMKKKAKSKSKRKHTQEEDVLHDVFADSGMMFPGYEKDSPEIHKIPLLLFLDTSGSCEHLAQRFMNAARTIPEKYFDVHVCGFTHFVYEIDIKQRHPKLYSGGTRFDILERYCLEKMKTYPHVIFTITDGYGSVVRPKFPERWHWFLDSMYEYEVVDDNGNTHKVPQVPGDLKHLVGVSKIYDLSKFE